MLRPGVPRSSSAARRLNLRGGLGRLRAGSAPLVPAPRLLFLSLYRFLYRILSLSLSLSLSLFLSLFFSVLLPRPSQSRLLDISSYQARVGVRCPSVANF